MIVTYFAEMVRKIPNSVTAIWDFSFYSPSNHHFQQLH